VCEALRRRGAWARGCACLNGKWFRWATEWVNCEDEVWKWKTGRDQRVKVKVVNLWNTEREVRLGFFVHFFRISTFFLSFFFLFSFFFFLFYFNITGLTRLWLEPDNAKPKPCFSVSCSCPVRGSCQKLPTLDLSFFRTLRSPTVISFLVGGFFHIWIVMFWWFANASANMDIRTNLFWTWSKHSTDQGFWALIHSDVVRLS